MIVEQECNSAETLGSFHLHLLPPFICRMYMHVCFHLTCISRRCIPESLSSLCSKLVVWILFKFFHVASRYSRVNGEKTSVFHFQRESKQHLSERTRTLDESESGSSLGTEDVSCVIDWNLRESLRIDHHSSDIRIRINDAEMRYDRNPLASPCIIAKIALRKNLH